MKLIFGFIALLFAMTIASANPPKDGAKFYTFKVKDIDGKEVDLSRYKGKMILIVNVASECGYTAQYEGLQKLFELYKDKLVILGFPSNNFGGQEPGSNQEIKHFCSSKFSVSFPMFEKVDVVGQSAHPLFKWLANKAENGVNDQYPKWNFNKYLINEKGELVKYFPSSVKPLSDDIVNLIK